MKKTIFFANDHAGFELKNSLIAALCDEYECVDLGSGAERADYPDYAAALARALKERPDACGVAICGSGIGISMAANRFAHVRAALVHSCELAALAREHNDANVIAFGARFCEPNEALKMLKIFLNTPAEGGRHAERVAKLARLNA